ncbi:hypothetical protein [Gluconacetobacter entanii]|uniref:hypothetical protein n=1 Tax=Gluconacetobacter entanii TaxID=108528 RepID=UPI0022365BA1|nr:hypothetical protein [Gluconacetobacter entanii]MCW4580416.1 hypothetical protein [Gluconacetobacter entanii]MCW4583737.1 hypothetical protein [Gluconacetobacter entanii]MCW4587084.1 hypothetical protein [Gluconacetobacter entanii]
MARWRHMMRAPGARHLAGMSADIGGGKPVAGIWRWRGRAWRRARVWSCNGKRKRARQVLPDAVMQTVEAAYFVV